MKAVRVLQLVGHLVGREFRVRYRRTTFGWLWVLVQPLFSFVVLWFVFSRVLPLDIPNYPAFLFTGLIAWQWFSSGVAAATTSAVDRTDLMLRPEVPRLVVPLVSVLSDGVDYLASLPILVVVLMLGDGLHWTAFALPAVLALQLLFATGLGLALCAANVHVRDVHLLVNLALVLGFYATPVFYTADALLRDFAAVVRLNPMAGIIEAHRAVLIEGQLPDPASFAILAAVCVTVFCAGYAVFRNAGPTLVDEI